LLRITKLTIDESDPPPPILKTWRRLYAAVLINLALLVALFYLFTRAFA
jgi:hypothetical protein